MASDKTKVDLPRDYKIPELRPYTTLDEKYGNLQSGHYFADKEDVVADKAKELAGDLLFGEDSDNTNLLTGAVPFADAAIKASEGKRPGLLDVAGDLKIPMLAMSVPFIRRYHATNPENVRKIFKEGLKASKGADDVVYTSVRPNAFNGGDHDAVLELRIPKDDYRKMTRLDHNPSHDGALGWEDLPDDVHDIDPDLWMGNGLINKGNAKEFKTIPQHGRTDIFMDDIKPEWISTANSTARGEVDDLMGARFYDKVGADEFKRYMQEYETKREGLWNNYSELEDKIIAMKNDPRFVDAPVDSKEFVDFSNQIWKLEEDKRKAYRELEKLDEQYPEYYNMWETLLESENPSKFNFWDDVEGGM